MARRTQPVSIPGVSFVRELGGIAEYVLKSNGLRILLAPDTTSPVTGFMVTYHVGSRNEAIGYTGATHLLEHLMFKGSERFNSESGTQMEQLLEAKGAIINATTWFDRTNYYEIVPREVLPTAIAIEADRMRHARITQKDKESEMPIVWNEFERGENVPMEALDKQLWAIAYQAHPYHHSTIGWRSDIENVSIERLQEFYDEYYWPDNATATVVGGFDTKEVLTLIKKEFGVHTKSPKSFPKLYTKEPHQEGERRAVVRRAGVDMVGIGHKIPEGNHKDMPALIVLSAILAGDKASRLERALVDTAKATSVETQCYQLFDPGLLITYVTLTKGVTHEQVERLMKEEFLTLGRTLVPAKELARVKRHIRVDMANQRDGAYTFLATLNESIATGDWTRYVTLDAALANVTAADVKRVASTYLIGDQATVGWFINTAA